MYRDNLTKSIAEAAKKVMDEQLKGDQHKIDANKNNKIDAHDFKLLRSKKKVEESEQIDEISKATAKSYTIKKMGAFYADKNRSADAMKKDFKGLGAAHARLTGAKPTSEEVDQLDELSINKMLTYRSKATEKLGSDPTKDAKRKEGIRVSGEKVKALLKKEEVEEVDEGIMDKVKGVLGKKEKSTNLFDQPHVKKDTAAYLKASAKNPNGPPVRNLMAKEEVEELEEMFPGTPEYEKKFGKAPQDLKKGEKKKTSKGEMEGTGKGVVHKRKFSEMIETYVNGDIRDLLEALNDKVELIEEPTNDEFTAELEKAKAKATGKDKADVAAAATQSVKEIDEEYDQLDERELTSSEAGEKERIVKGMKKGLEGFKDRYGKDAKSVMYATATARAKEK
jgi:hypothetical protein